MANTNIIDNVRNALPIWMNRKADVIFFGLLRKTWVLHSSSVRSFINKIIKTYDRFLLFLSKQIPTFLSMYHRSARTTTIKTSY